MFEAAPGITPDEAKAALVRTAAPALAGRSGAGAGLVDASAAVAAAAARSFAASRRQPGLQRASGDGKIDSSRGSYKPYTDWKEPGKPEELSGEYDALRPGLGRRRVGGAGVDPGGLGVVALGEPDDGGRGLARRAGGGRRRMARARLGRGLVDRQVVGRAPVGRPVVGARLERPLLGRPVVGNLLERVVR